MAYKYNPLITGKLDRVGVSKLGELDDVNTAGTVNGKVLAYQSGTWIVGVVAGVGDMLKAEYVTGSGTVYNASRLAGDIIGTVQAHNVAASKVTTGTFVLARIPTMDDAHIPDLETLSYGAAFATAQIPAIGAYKTTSGTLAVARHETLDNLNGTVALEQIPTMDDGHIPDLDTLSYSGAFAEAQIPNLPTTKITSGTFVLARIPGTLTGKDADKVDGADAGVAANTVFKIPAGIAQGDIFHVNSGGSVVNLSAGTTGHFLKTLGAGTNPAWASVPGGGDMLKNVYDTGDNGIVDNSERLETNTLGTVQAHNVAASKVTTGTFVLARIPTMDDAHIPDLETLSYGAAFATAQIPAIGAYKTTSGTLAVARHETLDNLNGTVALEQIPTMDDAHIPDLETLSYGAAFATAQIPAIGAYKTTSGTLAVARHETLDNLNGTVALEQIPTMDDAHIPDLETLSYGAAFATAQIPAIGAYKTASGTLNADRIPVLPTARYGSAVLVSGTRSMTNSFRLKSNAGTTGMATVDGAIFFDTTADKVKVYVA